MALNGKLSHLGVGGSIAVVVLYVVFNFLVDIGVVSPAGSATPSSWSESEIDQVVGQVRDMHAWHDKNDRDGVKLWYVPRSMADAIGKQNVILGKLGSAIKDLEVASRAQTKVLERMDRRAEMNSRRPRD